MVQLAINIKDTAILEVFEAINYMYHYDATMDGLKEHILKHLSETVVGYRAQKASKQISHKTDLEIK